MTKLYFLNPQFELSTLSLKREHEFLFSFIHLWFLVMVDSDSSIERRMLTGHVLLSLVGRSRIVEFHNGIDYPKALSGIPNFMGYITYLF